MASLALRPGTDNRPACLALAGDLTIFEARDTHTTLLALLAEHPGPWSLDLGALGELDSAGLQLLLALARQFGGEARALQVVALSEQAAAVIDLLRPAELALDLQAACAG